MRIETMAVQAAGLLDMRGPEFLWLYLILMALALAAALVLRWTLRGPGAADDAPGARRPVQVTPLDVAYLSGGVRSAVDAAIASLVHAGAVHVDRASYRLKPAATLYELRDVHPLERAVFDRIARAAPAPIGQVRRDARPAAEAIGHRLAAQELSPPPLRRAGIRLLPFLVLLLPVLLGIVKIGVGLERDRPVGFLVLLTAVTGIVAVVLASRPALRTRKGDAILARLKRANGALRTSARHAVPGVLQPADVALAFALFGPAVLAAGPTADLERALKPPGSGGTGCGGGSSGCGGGSSCGGGGCGGCGGGGD